jgi:hypothetical protein
VADFITGWLAFRKACISERPRVRERLGSPGDAVATLDLNETLAVDEDQSS